MLCFYVLKSSIQPCQWLRCDLREYSSRSLSKVTIPIDWSMDKESLFVSSCLFLRLLRPSDTHALLALFLVLPIFICSNLWLHYYAWVPQGTPEDEIFCGLCEM